MNNDVFSVYFFVFTYLHVVLMLLSKTNWYDYKQQLLYTCHLCVLFVICLQLLREFEKLPRQYQFDKCADWWKILRDKMTENQKLLEVCSVSQLYPVWLACILVAGPP